MSFSKPRPTTWLIAIATLPVLAYAGQQYYMYKVSAEVQRYLDNSSADSRFMKAFSGLRKKQCDELRPSPIPFDFSLITSCEISYPVPPAFARSIAFSDAILKIPTVKITFSSTDTDNLDFDISVPKGIEMSNKKTGEIYGQYKIGNIHGEGNSYDSAMLSFDSVALTHPDLPRPFITIDNLSMQMEAFGDSSRNLFDLGVKQFHLDMPGESSPIPAYDFRIKVHTLPTKNKKEINLKIDEVSVISDEVIAIAAGTFNSVRDVYETYEIFIGTNDGDKLRDHILRFVSDEHTAKILLDVFSLFPPTSNVPAYFRDLPEIKEGWKVSFQRPFLSRELFPFLSPAARNKVILSINGKPVR